MADRMWKKLNELQKELQREERVKQIKRRCLSHGTSDTSQKSLTVRTEHVPREEMLRRLEEVIVDVLRSVSNHQPPVLSYNSRSSWQNILFTDEVGLEMKAESSVTEIRFDAINSCRTFGVILSVMSMCYRLLQSNTYSTKRDLYYNNTKVFGSQSVLDQAVENICCMLNVPRRSLHVLATSKGLIAGDLSFTEVTGNHISCTPSKSGISVPADVDGIRNLQSDATFVLIVEKDATFQKLLDDGLMDDMHPCIMITGKGFPDVNTRQMVRKLWQTLNIPILGLVDADPHGLEILCVYKFGSKSMSYESHSLTVPCIRWLGVLPSDINRLQVPRSALIPLTKTDLKKAQDLMRRPYYKYLPVWMKEVQTLMDMNVKAEIQCLTAISPDYLARVYIPNKISICQDVKLLEPDYQLIDWFNQPAMLTKYNQVREPHG